MAAAGAGADRIGTGARAADRRHRAEHLARSDALQRARRRQTAAPPAGVGRCRIGRRRYSRAGAGDGGD